MLYDDLSRRIDDDANEGRDLPSIDLNDVLFRPSNTYAYPAPTHPDVPYIKGKCHG